MKSEEGTRQKQQEARQRGIVRVIDRDGRAWLEAAGTMITMLGVPNVEAESR